MLRTQVAPGWPGHPGPPPVQIRPAGLPDSGNIRDFINGLSVRTQFLRFFASVAPASSSLLRGLCGTGSSADVMVATYRGSVIGHAMAVDRAGGDGVRISDVGLVVTDRWQQRGVGSALLRNVLARAVARGVEMLVMDVLPGNDQMLAMIERRWPGARREFSADSITIRVRLEAADGLAAPGGAPAGAARRSGIMPRPEGARNDASAPAA